MIDFFKSNFLLFSLYNNAIKIELNQQVGPYCLRVITLLHKILGVIYIKKKVNKIKKRFIKKGLKVKKEYII
jgi:hypothetical protein